MERYKKIVQNKEIMNDRPLSEITLRKYEHPGGLEKRALVRKICLSIGLLNPGDSRDVIVDILYSIFTKKQLTTEEIINEARVNRGKGKNSSQGTSQSNIRTQLRKLKNIGLIEKNEGKYRVREGLALSEAFKKHVREEIIDNILQRVEKLMEEADKRFS